MPSRTEAPNRTEIEPEVFLKRYRDIADKDMPLEEAKAALKSEIQAAKSSGINVSALKLIGKLRKMEPRDAQAFMRDTIRYMRWLGVNLLDQEELFDIGAPTAGLTEKVIATQAAWEAGHQGYKAGKAGHPLDANPYAPGTETNQRWVAEWYDGADDSTQNAKDIQPKDDGGGGNPEDNEEGQP